MKIKVPLLMVVASFVACSTTTVSATSPCPLPALMELEVGKYHLLLKAKDPICITVPGEFNIKIDNPSYSGVTVGAGDVTVRQKDDPATAKVLISGDNTSPVNWLNVKVEPATGETVYPDDEFDFWIDVKGVGILDPRIRVVPAGELNSLQWTAVKEVLDTWGLTFDDVGELMPPDDDAK